CLLTPAVENPVPGMVAQWRLRVGSRLRLGRGLRERVRVRSGSGDGVLLLRSSGLSLNLSLSLNPLPNLNLDLNLSLNVAARPSGERNYYSPLLGRKSPARMMIILLASRCFRRALLTASGVNWAMRFSRSAMWLKVRPAWRFSAMRPASCVSRERATLISFRY